MTSTQSVGRQALLCDLSRLFFSLRRQEVRLDYRAMVRELLGNGSEFAPLAGWTAFDPANDAQKRLHERLGDDGWHIVTMSPPQAQLVRGFADADEEGGKRKPLVPHEENIRFDTQIAFALGRLAGEVDRVVVVSDSFALADPVLQTVDRGTKVDLAFFSDELDARWMSVIKVTDGLEFCDLTTVNRESGGRVAERASARAIPGLR